MAILARRGESEESLLIGLPYTSDIYESEVNKMEEWKVIEIPEFQRHYEVSTLGRIRTIPHMMVHPTGAKRWIESHIKATRKSPRGYLMINIRYQGKHYTFRVHRVVAETFIPNPDNLPEVNHKDENKANNAVDNLEWCSHQYNTAYGTRGIRQGRKISILQKGRKISDEARQKIAEKARGRKHSEEWKARHSEIIKELHRQGRYSYKSMP